MANSAANWYPDPTGRFELRYWDGNSWTKHVANQGSQSTDLLIEAPGSTKSEERPSDAEAGTGGPQQEPGPTRVKEEHKSGVFARRREEKRAKAVGRDAFETTAMRAAAGDAAAISALPDSVNEARSLYKAKELNEKLWHTMAAAVRSVIDDDALTEAEEMHLSRLGDIMGTPVQEMEQKDQPLFEELVIAGINDGRLPVLPNPTIMLKRSEAAYASFGASLMKDQAIRQFQAGTSSVSVPLGHGVRYRVGGVRGRSVVVGTEVVVQDAGVLTVTNQRTVFTGRAKTLEFRNDKLVGLEQFADGLRLNVSNRQTASLFKVNLPSIAAAMITAAVAQNT